MFSFHKPRVYRSTEGCCICRAKSSSSRFTDSKKYENDSMKCFDLKQPRYGEICNACVLLVKRYKRLPIGSNRHWGHVVDARAGPGTKSLTKYKKHRDDIDSASISPTTSSNHQTHNSKSLIPEKFSKIFKKNKKIKNSSPTSLTSSVVGKKENGCGSNNTTKRKSSSFASSTQHQSWDNRQQLQSLPSTPDSLDSDYEDNRITSPSSTVVQFQTQTRASSYRSRNVGHISGNNTSIGSHKRRSIVKAIGSKRRKCLPPRKNNRTTQIESVQFFDESEWQERKSCCGMVYECLALGNTLLLDLEHYKPCKEHDKNANLIEKQQQQTPFSQKTTIATMPAVVQLAATVNPTTTLNIKPVSNNVNTNPTPVLKKHHLFFKRQSECFPHTDLSVINNNNNTNQMTITTSTKTDSQTLTENTTAAAITLKTISTDMTPPTITTLNSTAMTTNLSVNIPTTQSVTTAIIANGQQQSIPLVPRHSMAKITTITPTSSTIVAPLISNNNKSSNFLHKIKADTGKIVKHSLEKINTAVRLKPGDLHDMRHMIKTVDKSCLLTKQHHIHPGAAPLNQPQQQHHINNNNISIVSSSQTAFTTATLSSPSSSATKFSDNSSDSGFDENLQDRKSASPLQEDTEKKMQTRPGVQTMFLASGVQIQGQQQNLVLTGNEVAAKILQNRKQHATTALHQHNNHRPNNSTAATTTAVKIAQIVGGGASHKMRAIYNNNTIQHENGVTTIVPASSLTASSQTAAMSALAPSTVTITPSPTMSTTISNMNGKKISATPTPGHCVTGTNASVAVPTMAVNTNNIVNMPLSHNQGHVGTTHLTTISNNVSSLNQKIILVKTAKYNNSNSSNSNTNNVAVAATAASGHHQHHNAATSLNHLNHHSMCKN